MCFHDDNYICLCDNNNRAECFRYNSTFDQCKTRCLVNGQCIIEKIFFVYVLVVIMEVFVNIIRNYLVLHWKHY